MISLPDKVQLSPVMVVCQGDVQGDLRIVKMRPKILLMILGLCVILDGECLKRET